MFGLRRRAKTSGPAARVPDGTVVYAIGDIHGRLDLLSNLLGKIEDDAKAFRGARRVLVFVGDYVDRGPESKGVVERVAAGFPGFESVCLKGNHEQIMLDFLGDAALWDDWRRYGGLETLVSYGVGRDVLFATGTGPEPIREAFATVFPAHHRAFLMSLPLSFSCGDYYFAHAGARPGIPLESQVGDDLMWIREDFLNAGPVFAGRVVVHGHTPRTEPERRDFRIGIDTGAYLSGRLTAVRLHGAEAEFLQTAPVNRS